MTTATQISKNEQIKIVQKLRSEGIGFKQIADHLGKLGVMTTKGKPSNGYAYYLLNGSGDKKAKKTRKAHKRDVGVILSTKTKWDVLQAIEQCADFKPATQKALVGLILQELYK